LNQVEFHLLLQFLPAADCLRLASTSLRLRMDVAANGQINAGFWRRGRGVSLHSTAARAAGVIADGQPVQVPAPPGRLAAATYASLWRHVPEFRLVLTRTNDLAANVQLRLQRDHVGVSTGDILHMPLLRGLDLRNIQHLSSAVPVLERLAEVGAPPLAELILREIPHAVGGVLSDHVFHAVRRLPHLRSLTCTNPYFYSLHVGDAPVIVPSPLTHLRASNADCEKLEELRALNLVSLHLDQPRRLPRLFGIGVHGIPAHWPAPAAFQQLTDVRLSDFDAAQLFPAHEHGGPPLPASQYWAHIWPSLPHLIRLTLERVRNIDTLLESLLPLPGPAAAPGPAPCLNLRLITIPDGNEEFQPSAAMVNSSSNRTRHPARAAPVRIVFNLVVE